MIFREKIQRYQKKANTAERKVKILESLIEEMSRESYHVTQDLRKQKAFLETVISSVSDALFVVDKRGSIKRINIGALNLLGYSEEDLIGRDIDLLTKEKENCIGGLINEVVNSSLVLAEETILLAKDQREIEVGLSCAAMFSVNSEKKKMLEHVFEGVLIVAHDIGPNKKLIRDLENTKTRLEKKAGEHQRAQEATLNILEDMVETKNRLEQTLKELEQKEAQLIQAEKLSGIGQMAAGIAHEINNPLTCIMGFSQMMLLREDIQEELREDLQSIQRESKRCVAIIESLLNFARPKPALKKEIDIVKVLDATTKITSYSASLDKVEIIKEYDPSTPRLMADENRLQEVFMNLMLNAAMAMPEGGKLTIRCYQEDKNIVLSFSDEGIGMSESIKDKIFDPFFTTSYEKEYKGQKGTGLGLSISYAIIKEHGGDITVESKRNQGTTFYIRLPAIASHEVS
jgi:PAS domain S-box-containing protein